MDVYQNCIDLMTSKQETKKILVKLLPTISLKLRENSRPIVLIGNITTTLFIND